MSDSMNSSNPQTRKPARRADAPQQQVLPLDEPDMPAGMPPASAIFISL